MNSRFLLAASLCLPLATFVGCGGGGGGGTTTPTPAPSPFPSATPIGANQIIVQVRDSSGARVDGLVAIDSTRRATLNGDAIFGNLGLGAKTVVVEVGALSTSQNFTAVAGTTTVLVVVGATLTPAPPSTPAPPPF